MESRKTSSRKLTCHALSPLSNQAGATAGFTGAAGAEVAEDAAEEVELIMAGSHSNVARMSPEIAKSK
jgi:hypothetical protein